ncbi:WD40 repeat domain-containing protein [Nonomuraea sp. NPDC047897]|uniref:WD40 repeat domain-containing protein n=1 Tax=Nonomuraea sp. NPDC047897 TaxID=3364346 RepID=UPI00371C1E72
MVSRLRVAVAGLALVALSGGCGDQVAGRDRLPSADAPAVPSFVGTVPATVPTPLPSVPTAGVSAGPLGGAPAGSLETAPPATSLATPMATGTPRTATGPPRFFVAAPPPSARFPEGAKTAVHAPARAAVHDAGTGAVVADVPLPEGVRSSWHQVAATPDNRTFVMAGWTGPRTPLRFFRVTLGDDGRPGRPVVVPGAEIDAGHIVTAIALSADATRLALATPLLGGGGRISVLDLATGRRRDWWSGADPLVSGLAWAPDGRRLAWTAGSHGIGVLDLTREGTDLTAASTRVPLPERGLRLVESVAFTPDGRDLVYGAGHAVERVPADGGAEPRVLARPEVPAGASLSLRFSLDGTGRHLIFAHGAEAFRVDLTDGSTTPLPLGRSGAGEPPRIAW